MSDIAKLQESVQTMDALSQDGFSEISTLASMALKLMETEHAYLYPEAIAQVLTSIHAKANDIENLINSEAEEVGCNYKNEAASRRADARYAAEKSLKERCHG